MADDVVIYTEDDEKYGEEHREARRANRLIDEELSKVSWKIIRKFEELFPCKNPAHTIEVRNKEYVTEQNIIAVKMKVAKNQGVELKTIKEEYTTEHIRYETPEEFWKRWKKFSRVRSFV